MVGLLLHITLFSSLLFNGNSLFDTNFIGKHKDCIISTIKEQHKTLKLNTAVVNDTYNYLKFEDKINEVTVLFFLTKDDKCKMVRLMADYSNFNDYLEELNMKLKLVKSNFWQYEDNKTTYIVNLDEGDWFFTITIKEQD